MNRTLDETSAALIKAAHQLLAEVGPDALTVRRIANEAGMSTMNVYSRFGGKDGVIDELYSDGHRRLAQALEAVPSTDDIPGDLIRVAHAYRDFARDNPTYYGIMFRSSIVGFAPTQESIDLALQSLSSFVERVREGQERDAIVSDDGYDAIGIAAWLWASCHGMVSLELDAVAEEWVSWADIFEHGMRTAVRGLHPSAKAPLDQVDSSH